MHDLAAAFDPELLLLLLLLRAIAGEVKAEQVSLAVEAITGVGAQTVEVRVWWGEEAGEMMWPVARGLCGGVSIG